MNMQVIDETLLVQAAKEENFDDAIDLILEAYGQEDSNTINVLPNTSTVRDILREHSEFKDWEEHGFWIVTVDLPFYEELDAAKLFPYYGYNQRYDEFLTL